MAGRLDPDDNPRLEGLCDDGARQADRCIRIGRGTEGVERLEAHFTGQPFAPHRHDTYAIGVTLRGVQTFRYRGAVHHCLPGQWHVLHPDEVHDGAAGTADGFGYRILYLDPALVQQALAGRPLPFVRDPVVREPAAGLVPALTDLDAAIDDMRRTDIAVDAAAWLARQAGAASPRCQSLCLPALMRVREIIAADPAVRRPIAAYEAVTGLDRWTLARQFRAAFGTSPSRFRTMRQLDRARRLIASGTPLAEAALAAGFADQSHLSRLFKRSYGLTAARWRAAVAA